MAGLLCISTGINIQRDRVARFCPVMMMVMLLSYLMIREQGFLAYRTQIGKVGIVTKSANQTLVLIVNIATIPTCLLKASQTQPFWQYT